MAEPRLRLAPGLRLQWEPAQDAHVLLYPEGMVQLNDSAAEILKLCDGTRSADALVDELVQRFGDDEVRSDVREFLDTARAHGWIVDA